MNYKITKTIYTGFIEVEMDDGGEETGIIINENEGQESIDAKEYGLWEYDKNDNHWVVGVFPTFEQAKAMKDYLERISK